MSHFSPVSFMCKFFFKNCRALAKNCNAPINDKTGAEAKDWKGGKPVRVVRNCKGRKHSKYAPEEGNRYDGIYKVIALWFSCTICTISLKDGWGVYKEKLLDQILFLTFLIAFYKLFFLVVQMWTVIYLTESIGRQIVKYWAEKGKSGFLVWRYLLRRDDPAPAPWTKEGQKRAKELGLAMQVRKEILLRQQIFLIVSTTVTIGDLFQTANLGRDDV